MTTTRNFYGFAHRYGSDIRVIGAPHGDGGQLFVFDSRASRDDWISDGPAYLGENGARTKYPAHRVRAHVVTGEYRESDWPTRYLVDQACESYDAIDLRGKDLAR